MVFVSALFNLILFCPFILFFCVLCCNFVFCTKGTGIQGQGRIHVTGGAGDLGHPCRAGIKDPGQGHRSTLGSIPETAIIR